ncbi:hypothetical protein CMUS01_10338 [Colletotrichum musicola]|uniref:G domain-containing protein n=1 Tax=Colletotrichum musicola TaxID=2175873 RepID=A0A8H6N8G1_9PEZI|nr:hypothetical protein CMUS01_10338 [Colletotrichum musicola]
MLTLQSANDIVILVIGVIGSGKSSFIQLLVEDDVNVGHGLGTGTTHVEFYDYRDERHQRNIYLIDTPGLNDATRSDATILKEIAFTLTSLSLRMLKAMCGESAYPHVVLVANMGGSTERDEASLSQLVSRQDWWGDMKAGGSQVTSHSNNAQSAGRILRLLIDARDEAVVLAIQRELVDENRSLEDTGTGRELGREIDQASEKLRARIRDMISAEQQAAESGLKSALARQRGEMQQDLERANESHKAIRMSLEKLTNEQALDMMKQLEREQKESEESLARLEKDLARAEARHSQLGKELSEELRQLSEQVDASKTDASISEMERRDMEARLKAVQRRRDKKAKGKRVMGELKRKIEIIQKRRRRRKQMG